MPGQIALSFAIPSVHHLLFLPSTMEQKPIAPFPQVLSLFQQASHGVATGHSLPSSPASAQLTQPAQSCFASMYIPLHWILQRSKVPMDMPVSYSGPPSLWPEFTGSWSASPESSPRGEEALPGLTRACGADSKVVALSLPVPSVVKGSPLLRLSFVSVSFSSSPVHFLLTTAKVPLHCGTSYFIPSGVPHWPWLPYNGLHSFVSSSSRSKAPTDPFKDPLLTQTAWSTLSFSAYTHLVPSCLTDI